jgi:hypothetical protein
VSVLSSLNRRFFLVYDEDTPAFNASFVHESIFETRKRGQVESGARRKRPFSGLDLPLGVCQVRLEKVKGAIAVKHIAPFKSNRKFLQASGSIRRPNSLATNRVLQTESYNLRASRFGPVSAEAVKLSRTLNQTAKALNSPMELRPQWPLSYCGL